MPITIYERFANFVKDKGKLHTRITKDVSEEKLGVSKKFKEWTLAHYPSVFSGKKVIYEFNDISVAIDEGAKKPEDIIISIVDKNGDLLYLSRSAMLGWAIVAGNFPQFLFLLAEEKNVNHINEIVLYELYKRLGGERFV